MSQVSVSMTQASGNAQTGTYQSTYRGGYGGFSDSRYSGTTRAPATPSLPGQTQLSPTSSTNATALASRYGPTSLVIDDEDEDEEEDFNLTNKQADFRHECDKCEASFKRLGDLKRHYKKHFPATRIFHCKAPGCDKNGENGFYRRDNLMDHIRSTHPELVRQG
jgi:hypothetical protein